MATSRLAAVFLDGIPRSDQPAFLQFDGLRPLLSERGIPVVLEFPLSQALKTSRERLADGSFCDFVADEVQRALTDALAALPSGTDLVVFGFSGGGYGAYRFLAEAEPAVNGRIAHCLAFAVPFGFAMAESASKAGNLRVVP